MKLILLVLTLLMPLGALAATTELSDYKFLQTIPGVTTKGQLIDNFPDYITGIFNFGIVIVGIAALVMITIGGFWYVSSAGNQARATTAKSIITDAFLGLFVALFAFLILQTINPNLVKGGLSRLQGVDNEINGNDAPPTLTEPDVLYCDEDKAACFKTLEECESKNGSQSCIEITDDYEAPAPDFESHNAVKFRFLEAGISVKDNFPTTSLANLPESAIVGTISLKQACPSCEITVTGGTETQGHASHGPNIGNLDYRAKIGENDSLISYMETQNRQQAGTSRDEFPIYIYPDAPFNGARVIDERGRTDGNNRDVSHFHVEWP